MKIAFVFKSMNPCAVVMERPMATPVLQPARGSQNLKKANVAFDHFGARV
jgi:hypothetical protein